MKRATRKDAIRLLEYWMNIHGLTGWITKFKFVSNETMIKTHKEATTAAIEMDYANKTATVMIKKNISLANLELDIPHELGHMMFKEVGEAIDMLFDKYKILPEDQAVYNAAEEAVINSYRNILMQIAQ